MLPEKESDVAEKACATLIHTEVSNICNQSQVDSYKEMGVEKYKNLETLDGITCKVCGGHDGEVHDVDEFQVGLTAPPFHPKYRGTTIPVTDNLLSKNRQRAARDPETGKTVYVNEMTYEEWKENFVNEKGQQAWDYYSKSAKNLKIDKGQFDRYKDVLGKYAHESLEEFQKIKYNNTSKWNSLKHSYRVVNSYEDNSGSMDKMKIVELDDFAFNTKTKGFTGKAKNKANIAVMELDGEIKIANSQMDKETDPAFVNFKYDEVNKLFENKSIGKITKDNLVLQKENTQFETIKVGSHTREIDSEAKLFEYAADIAKDGKEHTINMLSEKCMCDSCLGVMKQFKDKYPNVTVNVVSNKKERAEKNHNKPWEKRKE